MSKNLSALCSISFDFKNAAMQSTVPSIRLVQYTHMYTHGVNVAITRIFRNGNSQAIRIPADIAFPETETEVEIERVGDELRIRRLRRPLAGALDCFGRFGADFMSEGRGDQTQDKRDAL